MDMEHKKILFPEAILFCFVSSSLGFSYFTDKLIKISESKDVSFGTRISFPVGDNYFICPFFPLLIVYLKPGLFIYDVSENSVK